VLKAVHVHACLPQAEEVLTRSELLPGWLASGMSPAVAVTTGTVSLTPSGGRIPLRQLQLQVAQGRLEVHQYLQVSDAQHPA
jgi:hypothetical protein